MASRLPIHVSLESFEGPLDLLLYLIQAHELNISKVSIGKITDQYLATIRQSQELNFEVASEFLLMAATLLVWKSRALLPKEETEEKVEEQDGPMSQEQLLRQLLELQLFKKMGTDLASRPLLGDEVFKKVNPKQPVEKIWKEMDASRLALSYQDSLIRERKRSNVLRKETVSLTEKIIDISNRLTVGQLTSLRKMMVDSHYVPEVVATFLASLEMARLRKLSVFQEGIFADIYVELIEKLGALDFSLIQTFEGALNDSEEKPKEA